MLRDAMTPEFFHRLQAGSLPDLLGLTIESIAEGEMRGSFAVTPSRFTTWSLSGSGSHSSASALGVTWPS